jgi:UDP-N-acetylmuramoyl-tripeptide--D-alanyl-D-alanine ligase
MRLTVADLAVATGGRVVGDPDAVVDGIANDSRTLRPGECFVAVVDRRDGHEFVAAAGARGATAAIVARVPDDVDPAVLPLVVVDDPMAALARAATWARRERLASARVVGVTGSTGKTSTKDLLAGALSAGRATHVNAASFNNEIGLPITILGAPDSVEVVVCEMGARFAGNIAELCAIAHPDVGVVTNLGIAHAEHLGGPEGVARVKGELLEALPAAGRAFLNADDERCRALASRTVATVVTAGTATHADVHVTIVDIDAELRARVTIESPFGSLSARLGLRGSHQALNAALAAAVALFEGIDPGAVAGGLEHAAGSASRMQLAHTVHGITVLDDSYNANPQSMRAGIAALGALTVAGRRVAVLGAMRELGADSGPEHHALGAALAAARVDRLVVVGTGSDPDALAAGATDSGVTVERAEDVAMAITAMADLAPGDAVLVKASRAVGLDAVVRALTVDGTIVAPEARTS